MNVLLVTSWDEPCGIAEHSGMLKEAVETTDPDIHVLPTAHALDPLHPSLWSMRSGGTAVGIDLVHLNYQAALHSRWTPERIHELRRVTGYKVLVTYHDTGVPNSAQCHAIVAAADAAIVHEPFDDLPADTTRYWRMGVPGWQPALRAPREDDRPILGSIGFPFGWKNYPALCEAAARAGWAVMLLAPGAKAELIAECAARNPHLAIHNEFLPRAQAVSLLTGCDATAFTHVTHNTGQSGAILLGIAARKPVIALSTCRQFRALYEDSLGRSAINWCATFEEVVHTLHNVRIARCDPWIVALAEQESWTRLGQRYAQLYQELAR